MARPRVPQGTPEGPIAQDLDQEPLWGLRVPKWKIRMMSPPWQSCYENETHKYALIKWGNVIVMIITT